MYPRVGCSCVVASPGECAVFQELQFRACFLVLRSPPRHPVIECSFPRVSHRHSCLCNIVVDETPKTFDHTVRTFCTSSNGFGVINNVVCQPHRSEEGFNLSLLMASRRLCTEPLNLAPAHAPATRSCCCSPPVICAAYPPAAHLHASFPSP